MLGIEENQQADMLRRLSILFVDDDADVCLSMSNYLSRRVAKIYTAQNGLEGLDIFNDKHPDMVISDIRMDGMDGLDLCRVIRKTEPELPVIFISGHNESDVLLSSIDLGITKFIVKPFRADVLMDAITSVANTIERHRGQEHELELLTSIISEADYSSERVKSYVAHYLDSNHLDTFSNIRHLNIPKLEVSGDFYSVAKHQDSQYVMLADAAGHGLPAVIPALQMPGIFQQQAVRGFSLITIAAEINRSLYKQHLAEHFVATTFVRINPSERFIEVLNCGNPPVFIFDDEGKLLHVAHSKTTALGMASEIEFFADMERFSMTKSARVYLFTDGLTDTLQTEELDDFKIETLFRSSSPESLFDRVSALLNEVTEQGRVDDISMLEIIFDCLEPPISEMEITFDNDFPSVPDRTTNLSQMSLLYVEDEELSREYLSQYLSRRLGVVYVAENGRDGLELFRKYRPQIVLADIDMPFMNGFEMAEAIRKLDKDVPIIVTSGLDDMENAEKMLEMSVSRFCMKPINLAKLFDTIETCVKQAGELKKHQLSSSAFQASSLAVITVDGDKRIIAVNPAFTRITGYSQDEVQGHSPTLFCHERHDSESRKAMWQALEGAGNWSGKLSLQHKHGAVVSEWLTVDAVTDQEGKPVGYHFVFLDNAAWQLNDQKFHQAVQRDELTRLPNRQAFSSKLNELLVQARTEGKIIALICLNIDHFIEINKELGMQVGDEVLLVVGQRLLAGVRSEDVVCRLGGDEFAIAMIVTGGRELIERSIGKLSGGISQPIQAGGKEVQLRTSIGISLYPSDGETYAELIKNASGAMQQAQRVGGNTYRFFDKAISRQDERQIILQQSFKSGLQKNEFFMLYQPKYSLSLGCVVGAEALVRWDHPILGLISPAEFIPLAEASGEVIELSEWIIDVVCSQIIAWKHQSLPQVPVSINISPVHFWRGGLVEALQAGMEKWGLSPEMLPIEVTEGIVMDTSENTMRVLVQLKELGFCISIDDFGTGYSSLKYLKDLPIGEVKIDRSFIIEISPDNHLDDLSKTAIPRAIIQLASELNLAVVAEGVETETQKNFLFEHGCDVIQGYLFSKPVPIEAFESLLANSSKGLEH